MCAMTGSRARSPRPTGWRWMTSPSSGDSGPGLSRISSGHRELPGGRGGRPTWSSARSGPAILAAPADRDRQIGRRSGGPADGVVLRRQGLEDRAHRGGLVVARSSDAPPSAAGRRPQRLQAVQTIAMTASSFVPSPAAHEMRSRASASSAATASPKAHRKGHPSPTNTGITSRTAWVGRSPGCPAEGGRRAHQEAGEGERDRFGRPGGPARRGQRGRLQPLAQPRPLGDVDQDAGRVGLAHRGDTSRGAAGGERPRSAPAVSAALRRRPSCPSPGPRGGGQLVDPQRGRDGGGLVRVGRLVGDVPGLAREVGEAGPGIRAADARAGLLLQVAQDSSHSEVDQPPPPTGSRLRPGATRPGSAAGPSPPRAPRRPRSPGSPGCRCPRRAARRSSPRRGSAGRTRRAPG